MDIIEYVDNQLDDEELNINFGNYYKLINKRRSFICGIKGLNFLLIMK